MKPKQMKILKRREERIFWKHSLFSFSSSFSLFAW